MVEPTQCNVGTIPAPLVRGATPLAVPSVQPLAHADNYIGGDAIFVRVTDYDRNRDPLLAETINITISTDAGDIETLIFTETGLSTGVFVGYIQSARNLDNTSNCSLSVHNNTLISAIYRDGADGNTIVAASALVDPYGHVFDTATGAPVDGVTITLINLATGLPAAVFCDDGVTSHPNVVVSGSTFAACGGSITFPPGMYRFPLAAPGNYRLDIGTVPTGFAYPSTVADAAIQAMGQTLPTPIVYALLPASRGPSPFALVDVVVRIDIPLDSANGSLSITKSALKATAAVGDYVPYTLSIRNPNAVATAAVQIADRLPMGFRYQKGSARLVNGVTTTVLADPTIAADGRTLTFSIGTIAAGATVNVKYVAAVVAGAKTGPAENTAQAVLPATSNMARATVLVREDLNRSRAILMGRVIVGSCDDDVANDLVGLEKARIVLQDGTYILTDKEGRWHADNIRPGTHVVQLDLDSLPKGYEVVQCQDNSRFAGRNYSQFVNVKGGSLWRADFYVRRSGFSPTAGDAGVGDVGLSTGYRATPIKPDLRGKVETSPAVVTPPVGANSFAQPASGDVRINSHPQNASPAIDHTQLVEKLPYDEKWLAAAAPGIDWLHPQESFQPALPVVKIAVKHDATHRVEMKLDGEKINPMRYEGIIKNAAGTLAISNWRAVDIKEGANLLEMTVFDAQGKMVKQEQRKLHYGSSAVKAVFDEKRSVLVADGKTRPVVAVRFLDKDGKPVRRGVSGEFALNAPYLAQSKHDGMDRLPLSGALGNKNRFTVADDGVALIALEPTTQSGEVVLGFNLNTGTQLQSSNAQKDLQEIRAWLNFGERDWILVGFAEGTAGHKQLSGNMESLKTAQADEKLFDHNRMAFYAKGMVKGEYLLTAAYDTAKETGQGGARNLKQSVAPDQYYTLFADATTAQFDAASASKLYLKIEKKQFYAMFGDYDTGLTVSELGRYSRTLNGIKSEFKGEKISYNAFATLTAQSYKKDEIQGDGTSGLYKLTSKEIVINSDKVVVEVRDRFQSQIIISKRNYTRYLDYDIDTAAGTLFFREPIPARDPGFNPVFIVVEYEAEDVADRKMSQGGRVALKIGNEATEKTEVGVTHIREGNVGKTANLTALDATVKLSDKTKLHAEMASSDRSVNNAAASGKAWLVEAKHDGEKLSAKAYVRETDSGFGVGQQGAAEVGMFKAGSDVRLKISDHLQVQGAATHQQNSATSAQRDTLEGQAQWQKNNLSINGGLRTAQDKSGAGVGSESNQALAGVAYAMLDNKLTLSANTEIDVGSKSDTAASADYPNRLNVGADYKLTEKTAVFAKHELARGNVAADTTSIGLRTQPWTGGESSTTLGRQAQLGDSLDSERIFMSSGLVQKLQINENWQADFGVDRSQTLSATAMNPLNARQPLASGAPIAAAPGINTGDYTSVHAGAGYNNKIWSGNGRIEMRTSETEDKTNLLLGAQRQLDQGRIVAAGMSIGKTSGLNSSSLKLDARLSYAHRPNDSRWVWLDKLDYVQESITSAASNQKARKLVNNFNANYMPDRRTQISLQYGSKYVMDRIDDMDFSGYTDLIGLEVRRDLGHRWDVGISAGMLHSWEADTRDYQLGASIGYRIMDNAWLSVGYNRLGFKDGNFSGAEYRAQGAYINLRMKVDQDTLGLNEKKSDKQDANLIDKLGEMLNGKKPLPASDVGLKPDLRGGASDEGRRSGFIPTAAAGVGRVTPAGVDLVGRAMPASGASSSQDPVGQSPTYKTTGSADILPAVRRSGFIPTADTGDVGLKPDLQQAEALLQSGNAKAAYTMLQSMEATRLGDPHFDYLLGSAALDAGEPAKASVALRRVLAINPDHGGAQIDLGRAYLALGNREQAVASFESALANDPPDHIRAKVLSFLKHATGPTAAPEKFAAYVQAGIGHDSNINSAGSEKNVFIPLFNTTLLLPGKNLKMSDNFMSLGAGANYRHDFDPEYYVFGGVNATLKRYLGSAGSDFSLTGLSGQGGAGYQTGRHTLEGKLNLGRSLLGDHPDRKLGGVAGEWRYAADENNQFSLFAQHNRLSYLATDTQVFDTRQNVVGLSWLTSLSDRLMMASGAVYGTEADIAGNPDGKKEFYSLKVAGEYKLSAQWAPFATFGITRADYSKTNAAFLTAREDTLYEMSLGATYFMADNWSLRPRVSLTQQDSNIAIYDYKKTEASATVRKDW